MPSMFKVWCKNRNEWEKHPCHLTEDGILIDVIHHIALKPETHEIVWFSNRTDKNGNPIYQNYIIKFHWSTFHDEYESTCLMTYENQRCRWLLEVIGKDEAAWELNHSMGFDPATTAPEQYEIIGNAYENPSLLGKGKGAEKDD